MKRRLEHGKEEILSNKKIKYDNQQDVSTNEFSHSEGQNNFNEKISLSDTDENVLESSSEEGIQNKTGLNSSSSSKTKVENQSSEEGSTKLSLSPLEVAKSSEVIDEVENNSIETNELLLKNIIGSYMETLKEGVADKDTYDYIIASILEIYMDVRSCTEVLNQIVDDITGITAEYKTYNSLCGLAISLAGYNRDLSNIFVRDINQEEVEWRDMIAGEVYNSIRGIYYIE